MGSASSSQTDASDEPATETPTNVSLYELFSPCGTPKKVSRKSHQRLVWLKFRDFKALTDWLSWRYATGKLTHTPTSVQEPGRRTGAWAIIGSSVFILIQPLQYGGSLLTADAVNASSRQADVASTSSVKSQTLSVWDWALQTGARRKLLSDLDTALEDLSMTKEALSAYSKEMQEAHWAASEHLKIWEAKAEAEVRAKAAAEAKAHARSAASQAAGAGESTEIASDADSEDVAQGNVAFPQFQEGYDGTQMREDIGKFGSSFIQAEYLQSALPIIEYDLRRYREEKRALFKTQLDADPDEQSSSSSGITRCKAPGRAFCKRRFARSSTCLCVALMNSHFHACKAAREGKPPRSLGQGPAESEVRV